MTVRAYYGEEEKVQLGQEALTEVVLKILSGSRMVWVFFEETF